ncbi:MAG: peptidoglycan DD-metalloendopeptidase family protein [Gemmatimonadaceae bacterium]|nr:peptidoglycan DD-metalloendopeptidase family protein [Gemmatimonadaceae bacterium]
MSGMAARFAAAIVVLAAGDTAPRGPVACGPLVRMSTIPARPKRGTLFVVRVTGAAAATELSGRVAGEALHFSRDTAGRRVSFAPAPIDSASLEVVVECVTDVTRDTLRVRLALARGAYAIEHLRVAPRFSAPPDSAIIARQQRESARAADVSRLAHDTPRLWSRPFSPPRASRITSRFGGGREFNGTVTSRHMGTDFAGTMGAPIHAANRGVVRLVDDFYLGGKVVYVDHGAGMVTAYLHMSAQRVAPGDTVERGTVLGLVGATGRVTGPHLHFIARYGAVTVDPQSLLDSAFGGGYVPLQ